ncbi:hypothetical protein [Paracraurococcus ruber]|uniref:hypothetical protein n=1 Tax=Paracraurococcus ruber TaxID=77675 RepID=UPI0018654552|nr:hypothetical protein [Paracraurococcus ruber]
MSNIAGKAYAMNVLTPIKPWKTWLQYLVFRLSRARPSQLGGLLGLKFIHFARWVVIRRDQWPVLHKDQPKPAKLLQNDYMLFLSNFNGTWDQYIDAFADGIPTGLDLLWYTSTKYPHSIPIADFKNYISANQIQTRYYYNATPGAAQRDIKQALVMRDELVALARLQPTATPAEFGRAYRKLLARVQRGFGAHGIAPAASPATERADAARRRYFDPDTWGRDIPQAPASSTGR